LTGWNTDLDRDAEGRVEEILLSHIFIDRQACAQVDVVPIAALPDVSCPVPFHGRLDFERQLTKALFHFAGQQVAVIRTRCCAQPVEPRLVHLQVAVIDQEGFREDTLPVG